MSLTDVKIKNAKPQSKIIRLHDEKGLYLEISPKGGKWWRFKYRFAGKEKRISLGIYPDVNLKTARNKRDEMRTLLQNKKTDPSEERKSRKQADANKISHSFENVTREWFSKFGQRWSKDYLHKTVRRFEMYVFPLIGKKPIADVNENDLLSVLQRVEVNVKGSTAHIIARKCDYIFRYAISSNYTKYNPCFNLKGALTPVKENHFKAQTDPEKVSVLLRKLDNYDQGTLVVKCALKLLPLIFLRSKELRQMAWDEVKWEAEQIELPAEKMKMGLPHIVPLSRQALAILHELRAFTGVGHFVFPHRFNGKKSMSENTILQAMRRLKITKDETCGHGFRATARSMLDERLGFRLDIIEHQLAHAVKDTNGRAYNRTTHLEPRREMMQKWADYLDGLKSQDTKGK